MANAYHAVRPNGSDIVHVTWYQVWRGKEELLVRVAAPLRHNWVLELIAHIKRACPFVCDVQSVERCQSGPVHLIVTVDSSVSLSDATTPVGQACKELLDEHFLRRSAIGLVEPGVTV